MGMLVEKCNCAYDSILSQLRLDTMPLRGINMRFKERIELSQLSFGSLLPLK